MTRINPRDWKAHKAAQKTATTIGSQSVSKTMPERMSNVSELDESGVYRKAAAQVAQERKIVASMLPRVALVCPAYCGNKSLDLDTTQALTLADVINADIVTDSGFVRWDRDIAHWEKITKSWLLDVSRDNVLTVNGKYVYPTYLLITSVEAYLIAIQYGQIGLTLACALTFGSSSKLSINTAVELIAMSRVDRKAGIIASAAYQYMLLESRLVAHDERIRTSGKAADQKQSNRREQLQRDCDQARIHFEARWYDLHAQVIDVESVAYDVSLGGKIGLIALASAETSEDVKPQESPINVANDPTIQQLNANRLSANVALAMFNQAQRAATTGTESTIVETVKPVQHEPSTRCACAACHTLRLRSLPHVARGSGSNLTE